MGEFARPVAFIACGIGVVDQQDLLKVDQGILEHDGALDAARLDIIFLCKGEAVDQGFAFFQFKGVQLLQLVAQVRCIGHGLDAFSHCARIADFRSDLLKTRLVVTLQQPIGFQGVKGRRCGGAGAQSEQHTRNNFLHEISPSILISTVV